MSEILQHEIEMLFQMHHKELISLSCNIVGDYDLAKDVVQDVFLNLWKNRVSIEFGDRIKHYLFKATAHTSINYLQATKKNARLTIKYSEDIPEKEKDSIGLKELKERTICAIERLPLKCKVIFLLSRNQGLKYKEIAELLGISMKTVENQMGIALAKLRADLAPYLGQEFLTALLCIGTLYLTKNS